MSVFCASAQAQDLQFNLPLIKKTLPLAEHRNCSMLLRNVRRDIDNQTLLMPPKAMADLQQQIKFGISFIDLLQQKRIESGEFTETKWKQLLDQTPKEIWEYQPIDSYQKAKICLAKLNTIADSMLKKSQNIASAYICKGEANYTFGGYPMDPNKASCGFSIIQQDQDTITLSYNSQITPDQPANCILYKISGNDTQNPNNKEDQNWISSKFTSRETSRTYAQGYGIDRSVFTRAGSNISFSRYNFQPSNGLNWTSNLDFNSDTKTIKYSHIYHDGKKVVATTQFNATCEKTTR